MAKKSLLFIDLFGGEKDVLITDEALRKMKIHYLNEGLRLAGKKYLERLEILAKQFSVTPKSIGKTLTELNKKIGD